tara:strand:+ start:176 stop:418 length:243 start_codon:yes stop_codon:yes gene_type:complete
MKKIFYLLPFTLLFILPSCKKCKDCSCSQVVSQTGVPDFNQDVQLNDVCDEDLEEIEGSITFNQSVGGVTQTVEQTCDCK